MEPVIIIHYGEIALKGKNRQFFVRQLKKNIRVALADLEGWRLRQTHGRLFVEFAHDTVGKTGTGERVHRGLQFGLAREARDRLQQLPGIVAVSPAVRTDLALDRIFDAAELVLDDALRRLNRHGVTFKVETRRPNKSFPMTSPEVSSELGGHLLNWAPAEFGLTVDVHQPDIQVDVELREEAYVHAGSVPGPGGLPVGVSGRGLALLSGGIDSPVALWLALKRGIEMHAVHFHSFPFTSDRARQKVEDLCEVIAPASAGTLKLHVVHFTDIQKLLQSDGPPALLTILMRRSMMRIAAGYGRKRRAGRQPDIGEHDCDKCRCGSSCAAASHHVRQERDHRAGAQTRHLRCVNFAIRGLLRALCSVCTQNQAQTG